MLPVLSLFLCDNESLFEYERRQVDGASVDFRQICRRLIAIERQTNPLNTDVYYEGLREVYLSEYKNLSEIIWKLPYKLSDEYLFQTHDSIYVKAERFNGWMDLITRIPPSLIVAAAFLDTFSIEWLHKPVEIRRFIKRNLSVFQYTAQLSPYVPDLNYLVQKEDGLHDLHMHLNGTTETDVLWGYMLRNPYSVTKDFMEAYNAKGSVRKLSEQIIADFTPMKLLDRLQNANQLRKEVIRRIACNHNIIPHEDPELQNDFDSIEKHLTLYDFCGGIDENNSWGAIVEELFLYILVLSEIRENEDEAMAKCFHHYLLIKGLIHRFLVMQRTQVGFSQFQMLTDNSFRYGAEKQYEKRFLQLTSCSGMPYLKTIEGRFSPKKTLIETSQLVSNILRGYDEACKKSDLMSNTELVLVAHFIKEPESEKSKHFFIRHRFLRKNLKRKALALCQFLKQSKSCSKVVGIDAAASELDAGPEVFAPTFRFLRKKGIEHCTFHIGEDFRHLLSGLRGIWEAISFLDLQSGDRLGHCTAIGISPELWSKRIGNICFVSQGEWLDDLVFVWHLIRESQNRELQSLILSIESAIYELSYKIYRESFTPYLLCRVWQLRKYDPFRYLELVHSTMNDWDDVDSCEERKIISEAFSDTNVERLMRLYHASLSEQHVRKEYDKLIQIETTELVPAASLVILQNIVLEKMAKTGIVVEALPSSNLRISYYKELNEYHLTRWLEMDKTDCLLPSVVLGTDDPGIFMTNIYNEYARAYLHLESCGFSSMKRMNIISNLQRCSNIYKFTQNG